MPGPTAHGWLSNLSISKSKGKPKGREVHDSRSIPFYSQPSPVLSQAIEVNDQDDDGLWYDCTSSEGSLSPVNITPEKEAELLPYMPSLFDLELPPCNPEIQVAYENVVLQLRARWLKHCGRVAAVVLCFALKDELSYQSFLYPPFSLKGAIKKRKPWRRENVFKYELRWIDYFVKEVQAQSPELMTESEIMERKKEASAPAALGLTLDHQSGVGKMWDEWNARKRIKTKALPAQDSDKGLASGESNGDVPKETNGNVKESISGSIESDLTIVKSSTENGDAHHLPNGDHN